jgi:SNF2 family DNA or RNA helicase
MLRYDDLAPDQLDAIRYIGAGEDALLCADVGTGKTVISLTAAREALERGEVKRWLVAAPLMVANDAWYYEPGEWEHLQDLHVAHALGPEKQRLAALEQNAPITVINYENLPWLMDQYPKARGKDPLPFDGLICDEIDKLKSVSTNRFKTFRNRIKVFNKRIGLTGTLLPNNLEEIWGQVYIVDGGQSFGRSFYEWRKEFFYPTDFKQYSWAPFADTRDEIIDTLSDITYRLRAVGLPEPVVHDPHLVDLPPEMAKLYSKLERDCYAALKGGREVSADNAGVLVGKLQQICAGFSYVDEGEGVKKRTQPPVWHAYGKLDWLDGEILRSGAQTLVFYHYQAELAELQRRHSMPHIGGGQSTKRGKELIRDWNAGNVKTLALHPAAAGHGLNLQKSNAHRIAFLTIPWSGGMWRQVIGRLARRGNQSKNVDVYTALYKDTIDQVVFDTVTQRVEEMDDFLNALEKAGKTY